MNAPGSGTSAALRLALGIASALTVAAIFTAERKRPLRRQRCATVPRTLRNLAMGASCAAVIAAVEMPAMRSVARSNVSKRRGLAHRVPRLLRPFAAFLAMDYGFYLWHIATHRVPLLWRFHRVHHVDPDMDMSTAVRFHFGEMLISLPWRFVQVRLSGIAPATLDAWQRFFMASVLFHHSNLDLPRGWDARLSLLLTTPRMHGIHHSTIEAERASNWSSGISIWDRLHGTFRTTPQARAIEIGLDEADADQAISLAGAIRTPFRSW